MLPVMTGLPKRGGSNARCAASTSAPPICVSAPPTPMPRQCHANATPMRLKGGGTHLGYQTHYVVDGGRKRIIVGVLVAPGEVMENQPMLDLLWRVRFRWKVRPRQVTGDTTYATYGTMENIRAVEDMGIHAYMPLPDWEQHSPYFGASKFTYDAEHDCYRCPNGPVLRRTHTSEVEQRVLYRAQASTCRACPLRTHCTPARKSGRSVWRSFGEECVERVQAYRLTDAYQKTLRKRKVWVEPLFAEAKVWHGLRRFRLRRLWRVNSEALMTAAGQNLKRLLAKQGWGRRPLPSGAALTVANPIASASVCFVWKIILVEAYHRSRDALPDTRQTFVATWQRFGPTFSPGSQGNSNTACDGCQGRAERFQEQDTVIQTAVSTDN